MRRSLLKDVNETRTYACTYHTQQSLCMKHIKTMQQQQCFLLKQIVWYFFPPLSHLKKYIVLPPVVCDVLYSSKVKSKCSTLLYSTLLYPTLQLVRNLFWNYSSTVGIYLTWTHLISPRRVRSRSENGGPSSNFYHRVNMNRILKLVATLKFGFRFVVIK